MGGIQAPLVSLAYYGVILWAGFVSTTGAVFFATCASVFLFSLMALLEHFGFLLFPSYYEYKVTTSHMLSLLLGNVAFLFAFGYFSANSSRVIKRLERRRYEDSLRHAHRFSEVNYLVGYIVHDALNQMINIEGYSMLLLEEKNLDKTQEEMLRSIDSSVKKSTNLLSRLIRFSRQTEHKMEEASVNRIIEDTVELVQPFTRYSNVVIEKILDLDIPQVLVEKDRIQEVFVVLVLNAFEAMKDKGKLIIETSFEKNTNSVKIIISDTGEGIKPEDVDRIKTGEPFLSAKKEKKTLGVGLVTAYEIINRHRGNVGLESTVGKGTTFTIQLPAVQKGRGL